MKWGGRDRGYAASHMGKLGKRISRLRNITQSPKSIWSTQRFGLTASSLLRRYINVRFCINYRPRVGWRKVIILMRIKAGWKTLFYMELLGGLCAFLCPILLFWINDSSYKWVCLIDIRNLFVPRPL